VNQFVFIDTEKALYPVTLLCRLLKVSRSGFYAWHGRPASARRLADEVLTEQIRGFYVASRETYGAPRIHADLADAGVRVGVKRVARLMRADRLVGVSANRTRYGTGTIADPAAAGIPDLVDRKFTATRPDQLRVADVTYVPTMAGWLYLATVLDVFSRRVIGWSMASHRKTVLVVDAVAMAVARRRGEGSSGVAGVIHHSDHGGEYVSHDLARQLASIGAVASMGSVGDCYDNSLAESLFSTLEKELFARQENGRFTSHREAKLAIFDYLESFYNRRRRHTSIGMRTPEAHEQHQRHLTLAA
jgi:putative transposase